MKMWSTIAALFCCCIYLLLTIEFTVCPPKEVLILRNPRKMMKKGKGCIC